MCKKDVKVFLLKKETNKQKHQTKKQNQNNQAKQTKNPISTILLFSFPQSSQP